MLQKIIGIVGVVAVAGVIVMVALSPKKEGFFPDMFSFLKRKPAVETVVPQTPVPVAIPPADTLSMDVPPADTLPADIPEEPAGDTIVTE